jgi:DNA-binding transcriptional ArsR family regulator
MVFDREDLQRVRLADRADPMWELVFALHKTQVRRLPAPLEGWRQETGRRFASAGRRQDSVALLQCLVPAQGPFSDFLTPPGPTTDLDAGCEAVRRTPRALLAADLSAVFARRVPPPWIQSLARGDGKTLDEVVRAVRDTYDLLIAPHWADVCEVVTADSAARTRVVARQGVGALLSGLPGVVGWDGRVLTAHYPVDRTLRLAGRGLVLVPSYFCWHNPVTLIDAELPPVLVYQAHSHRVPTDAGPLSGRLTSLVGRTRAECLRALLVPRTTSELAERLGISVGSASKQAAILRDAGLVTSDRRGAAVLHTTTALGTALLTGEPKPIAHTGQRSPA